MNFFAVVHTNVIVGVLCVLGIPHILEVMMKHDAFRQLVTTATVGWRMHSCDENTLRMIQEFSFKGSQVK